MHDRFLSCIVGGPTDQAGVVCGGLQSGNFLPYLTLPASIPTKPSKIGVEVACHAHRSIFQMAQLAVPKDLLAKIFQ